MGSLSDSTTYLPGDIVKVIDGNLTKKIFKAEAEVVDNVNSIYSVRIRFIDPTVEKEYPGEYNFGPWQLDFVRKVQPTWEV